MRRIARRVEPIARAVEEFHWSLYDASTISTATTRLVAVTSRSAARSVVGLNPAHSGWPVAGKNSGERTSMSIDRYIGLEPLRYSLEGSFPLQLVIARGMGQCASVKNVRTPTMSALAIDFVCRR